MGVATGEGLEDVVELEGVGIQVPSHSLWPSSLLHHLIVYITCVSQFFAEVAIPDSVYKFKKTVKLETRQEGKLVFLLYPTQDKLNVAFHR